MFGSPAFFNNRLYFQGNGLPLKAFAISNATINPVPISQSSDTLNFRGATPSVSANGTANGVVWEVSPTASPWVAGLRAYRADDLSKKLYDSYDTWQAGAPDRTTYVKFAVPTVANGKVYVGATNELAVFGLRSVVWSITRQASPSEVHIVFSGPDGRVNLLQASNDLVTWTDLGLGTPTGSGTYTYSEPISPSMPTRFYRIKP